MQATSSLCASAGQQGLHRRCCVGMHTTQSVSAACASLCHATWYVGACSWICAVMSAGDPTVCLQRDACHMTQQQNRWQKQAVLSVMYAAADRQSTCWAISKAAGPTMSLAALLKESIRLVLLTPRVRLVLLMPLSFFSLLRADASQRAGPAYTQPSCSVGLSTIVPDVRDTG